MQVWNAVNATYGRVLVKDPRTGHRSVSGHYSSIARAHRRLRTCSFGEPLTAQSGFCPYCKEVAKMVVLLADGPADAPTVTNRLVA